MLGYALRARRRALALATRSHRARTSSPPGPPPSGGVRLRVRRSASCCARAAAAAPDLRLPARRGRTTSCRSTPAVRARPVLGTRGLRLRRVPPTTEPTSRRLPLPVVPGNDHFASNDLGLRGPAHRGPASATCGPTATRSAQSTSTPPTGSAGPRPARPRSPGSRYRAHARLPACARGGPNLQALYGCRTGAADYFLSLDAGLRGAHRPRPLRLRLQRARRPASRPVALYRCLAADQRALRLAGRRRASGVRPGGRCSATSAPPTQGAAAGAVLLGVGGRDRDDPARSPAAARSATGEHGDADRQGRAPRRLAGRGRPRSSCSRATGRSPRPRGPRRARTACSRFRVPPGQQPHVPRRLPGGLDRRGARLQRHRCSCRCAAGVTLKARPPRPRARRHVRFSGRVLGGPISRARQAGRPPGVRARPLARRSRPCARTAAAADVARYRFTRSARGRSFRIRAVARREARYPYSLGWSHTIRVRVR